MACGVPARPDDHCLALSVVHGLMSAVPDRLGAMLQIIVWILASVFGRDADSERLRASAPDYLDNDQAVLHLWSARVAVVAVELPTHDPDGLVLALGWHESRYQVGVVSTESNGRVSCGVMTPEPLAKCPTDHTMVDEYMVGALHLRGWFEACRGNRRCALLGYAGGYRAIRACAQGPVLRHGETGDDLCRTPEVFEWRARLLKPSHALRQPRPST